MVPYGEAMDIEHQRAEKEAELKRSANDWLENSGHAVDCDCPTCECALEHY